MLFEKNTFKVLKISFSTFGDKYFKAIQFYFYSLFIMFIYYYNIVQLNNLEKRILNIIA
jgi:hypothetical protein